MNKRTQFVFSPPEAHMQMIRNKTWSSAHKI